MIKTLSGKDLEITKAILEWLQVSGFQKSAETLLTESNLKQEDVPKTKVLEKKWTVILTMQKKISDLENKMKTIKEEYEQAALQGISYNNKKDTSNTMVSLILIFFHVLESSQSTRKAISFFS